MYKAYCDGVSINVELDNGVYLLSPMSAIGKTRLGKLLREIQYAYGDASYYTYGDKVIGFDMSKCVNSKYKVIMIDRYDMYNGDGKELIDACKNSSIVLIDCKRTPKFSIECDGADIVMSENEIVVTQ